MNELLFFNGIDGSTGEYLLRPMTMAELSRMARGIRPVPGFRRRPMPRHPRSFVHHIMGNAKAGINHKKLEQTGWGVIFAEGADPAIREALSELLSHRRKQATQRRENYYREYVGTDGYRLGESKVEFLARHGAGAGPADPKKVPYYLLIVGDPETIPFTFQYQLDVTYGVGRIHFNTLDEYAHYARSVVSAETGAVSLPRRAVFFGTEHDPATEMSAKQLVEPLADLLRKGEPNWTVTTVLKDEALKSRLAELFGGNECPALLFTASHGVGFPSGDSRQLAQQGALVCQDSLLKPPGTPTPPEFFFSGDDVSDDTHLLGMISFHFACYGAGTPQFDNFNYKGRSGPSALAPRAFLAHLPQRLLSHPKGGALAVIGHVDQAWGYSFAWKGAGRQLATIESTMKLLMGGYPVGYATEYLNQRWVEILSDLEALKQEKKTDDEELCELWTACNDAKSYTVVGDPAVRLPLSESSEVEDYDLA